MPVSTLDSVEAAVAPDPRASRAPHPRDGDFDADGATSTALIVRCLRAWGFTSVDFLVPNRFEFGYGLTPEIVGLAAERAPALIVTVDNGISSNAGCRRGRARAASRC
jgi:single-stranded-DNA-specific exonuclease